MTQTTIKICPNHPERETPLIWTFAFPGAEYWCPHCEAKAGAFDGFGKDVPETPLLKLTRETDQHISYDKLKSVYETNYPDGVIYEEGP